MMVYKSEDHSVWTRPRNVFFELVQHEGKTVPRFVRIN
jgi:hypothetical protein